ncbi:MAG: hypothetical protein LUQ65_09730 [Candidatus Helarchaeota archaeon]|nr:hypothetical protein [Candidatus Helarchaeota archaeon]
MSLRVVFDESHGEVFSVFNCKGLAFVLDKLKITPLQFVMGPLTADKIIGEDVLFLGAPTIQFTNFEIRSIEYFVSQGKFLIIACPLSIPSDFTLNELVRKFGMQFEHLIVQDKAHNLDGAMYFPIIKDFAKDIITQEVKELLYSGTCIKVGQEIRVLAASDKDAEPPYAPIIATTQDSRVICIGGTTIFQDDKRYGIKAKNNIRLVANIFRSIMQQQAHSMKEEEERDVREAKVQKLRPIDPKKAKRYFEKFTQEIIADLKGIAEKIDTLFKEISDLITARKFAMAEETLKAQYQKYKMLIEGAYNKLQEKLEEFGPRIDKNVDFPAMIKDLTDNVLVVESEALSKLDMIRFNLANQITTEKIRHSKA